MPAETVVITGATAGVGRATARAFARHGARIGLLARDADRLKATAAEVRELGGEAFAVPTDVADAGAVDSAAAAVERQFGPIDIWINNAMATIFAPVAEITPAAGVADLSAGGRGRSDRLCRACEAARDRCRRPDGRGDHRQQSRAGAARLVPGAHLL